MHRILWCVVQYYSKYCLSNEVWHPVFSIARLIMVTLLAREPFLDVRI